MVRRMAGFLLLSAFALQGGASEGGGVKVQTLKNGLKVIVKEDHRAPVAVFQLWYKVGSSYEHDGITGISHMLEHMMFKGTEKLGPGEYSRIVSENGGEENAFTGNDYTAYYVRIAKERLPIVFELEADRMANLKLDPEEFAKEREVVIEERRLRTEDRPRSLAFEHFMAVAFTNSPYRHPVIGWPSDLREMTLEDLRNWYRLWYRPDNAVLVVVGDVAPGEIFSLAEKWFGPIQKGEPREVKSREEVPQLGERRLEVRREEVKVPYLLMGYKVPTLATLPKEQWWEPYALLVAASLLSGGESARLPRELVRKARIAASASASYDPYDRLTTLFLLSGTPAQNHSLEELEKALRREVERLASEPIPPEELKKVKNQLAAEAVYERDSMFYQAMLLGRLEAVGIGWEEADRFVDRVEAVTAEQVQEVVRRYLLPKNLTVAYLKPEER